jgi:DHA2 family methylenomycin A resistance protein-like MFS transporter
MSNIHSRLGAVAASEAAPQPQREQSKRMRPDEVVALIAICLGFLMVILDTTIVNVSLASIHHELGASISALQWIVDGYTLVFASFLLTGGMLGDRLGSKGMFQTGLVLFTSASFACGASPTLWVLQIARVVQGAGAALLVPSSLALLNHTFTDQKERARAVGIWGAMGGIGAAAGPVLGGFLVNAFGWRSIFFVNVPIGILGFFLTIRFVAIVPHLQQKGLDLAAQIASVVALVALTFALIEGQPWGWMTLPILGTLGIFVLATIIFLLIERWAENPMLPLGFFSSPTFSSANAVALLLNFGFYGQFFIINLFFLQVLGYPASLTGLALLPQVGVVTFASFLSGRITAHTGPRLTMVIGQFVGGIGLCMMFLVSTTTSYAILAVLLLATGFGLAFTVPAMTTAVIASVPKQRSGIAAAVLNASRQVGSALGVALLGSMVGQRQAFIPGMHIALIIAGAAFLLGCLLSLFYVRQAAQ